MATSAQCGSPQLACARARRSRLRCQATAQWDGIRVAYQGVPGAYSEQAALLAYRGSTAAPYDQFELAFEVRKPGCAHVRTRSLKCLGARRWSSSSSTAPCCPSRTLSGRVASCASIVS